MNNYAEFLGKSLLPGVTVTTRRFSQPRGEVPPRGSHIPPRLRDYRRNVSYKLSTDGC